MREKHKVHWNIMDMEPVFYRWSMKRTNSGMDGGQGGGGGGNQADIRGGLFS